MNLKDTRKKLELTQERAAGLAGVTITTWNRWENGKNTPTPRAGAIVALMERAAATPPCKFCDGLHHNPGLASEDHIQNCPRCQVARIGAINRAL